MRQYTHFNRLRDRLIDLVGLTMPDRIGCNEHRSGGRRGRYLTGQIAKALYVLSGYGHKVRAWQEQSRTHLHAVSPGEYRRLAIDCRCAQSRNRHRYASSWLLPAAPGDGWPSTRGAGSGRPAENERQPATSGCNSTSSMNPFILYQLMGVCSLLVKILENPSVGGIRYHAFDCEKTGFAEFQNLLIGQSRLDVIRRRDALPSPLVTSCLACTRAIRVTVRF